MNPDGTINVEIFTYDPSRLQWIRVTEPVDLGKGHKRRVGALVLTPFTLAVDGAVAVGLAILAAISRGGGGDPFRLTYELGSMMFRIAPHNMVEPISKAERDKQAE